MRPLRSAVFAFLAVFSAAGPALSYDGILPEPVFPGVTYGSANQICPAHPTKWVTSRLWAGKPVGTEGPRFIAHPCVYCNTGGMGDCQDQVFIPPVVEPGRIWLYTQGGPCPPGIAADTNLTITKLLPFQVATTGSGCNSGPDMPE